MLDKPAIKNLVDKSVNIAKALHDRGLDEDLEYSVSQILHSLVGKHPHPLDLTANEIEQHLDQAIEIATAVHKDT